MNFRFLVLTGYLLAETELYCESKRDHEQEYSRHLESAVEDYMWGAGEIAIGVAEICRGDPLGGALIIADGVRNFKEASRERGVADDK